MRDFKGIWIPKEIWINEKLTIMEKLFLVEIDSLDGKEGCYAKNEHFAKFFDLSKNRSSEIIKSLEKKKLIHINYLYKKGTKQVEKRIIKVNKAMVLGLNIPPSENRQTPSENRQTPSENLEDNNTSFNNTTNNKIDIIINAHAQVFLGEDFYQIPKAKQIDRLESLLIINMSEPIFERFKQNCKSNYIDTTKAAIPYEESNYYLKILINKVNEVYIKEDKKPKEVFNYNWLED